MKFDFDKVVDRHGTKCLKYDFAKERGEVMICFRSGWQIWISRQHRESRKASDAVAHGIYGYSEGKMITSRQQPDGMRSISDGK